MQDTDNLSFSRKHLIGLVLLWLLTVTIRARILFTFMANAVFLIAGAFAPVFGNLFNRLLIERVVHPCTLSVGVDDSALGKNFHMIGKCRLCDIEVFQNIAGTELTTGEHVNDFQSRFICQSFEKQGEIRIFIFHYINLNPQHRHKLITLNNIYIISRKSCLSSKLCESLDDKNYSCILDWSTYRMKQNDIGSGLGMVSTSQAWTQRAFLPLTIYSNNVDQQLYLKLIQQKKIGLTRQETCAITWLMS